ncbi:MAG: hypothetical protein A3C06_04720 [Candidatus Taylorbacteria bacterium RIFCSPHIGHO2_02_FULL_46_13]|uniref:Uncharacterized protein n=1 Tax=Candidatus Taylorbacteria bacterium RIFCSPHIGHO2_02_FULL_46_13 TaxID=1802312 RepID=A0A1G2MRE1_9BACT|nr:MAG: hypothetical protein A3C06_04720 [Candidatus Taylorbacteria bacterium RIFCSPHIGHO2_02_FULL_46_13]
MLVKTLQTKILEKVVRGKNGQLFCIRFEVTEIDGRTYGRILCVSPISELKSQSAVTIYRNRNKNSTNKPYLLRTPKQKAHKTESKDFNTKILSPHFSLDFFTSQMTRAPSA